MNRRSLFKAFAATPLLPWLLSAARGKRISCDMDDPDYLPANLSSRYKVYLDGEEVRYCVTADETRGEVVVLLRENGKFVLNTDRTAIARVSKFGIVKLVL